jgi:hypothetical protein
MTRQDLDVARACADSITPEALEKLVHYGEPEVPAASDFDRLRELFSAACNPQPTKEEAK